VHADDVTIDWSRVRASIHEAIATIAPHDAPERLRAEGVEVRHAEARFVSHDTVEVDGERVRFLRAMVATGAAPVIPDLPGIADAPVLTSETVWGLEALPRALVVLGGGAIGVELAQAFARLGSRVTLVEVADRLLPGEEPEASPVVTEALRSEGVDVHAGSRARAVVATPAGHVLQIARGGGAEAPSPTLTELPCDALLVAVGRRPRTEGLGLADAGVRVDARGAVEVDRRLRTSNPRIYAGGDVTLRLPFTHTAAAHGAAVVQHALYGLRPTVHHERIPRVVFSSPEVARVGPTVAEARRRHGPGLRVRRVDHTELDRAVTDHDTRGFAQVIADRRGRLLGATVVGPRAGETIGETVAWLANDARLTSLVRSATHAYPTWSEDLATASLEELRAGLARIRPVTRLVLALRRRLG
jgi:pyruvate/2-oxoglutarate dehydrogenase complex dihydrolipoamide dehydrogenase (E3) component